MEVLQSPVADFHVDIREAGVKAISMIAHKDGGGSSEIRLDHLAACEGACLAYSNDDFISCMSCQLASFLIVAPNHSCLARL